MSLWQTLLTAVISATVALGTVFIKPVVEAWFEHRRRRVIFRWDTPVVVKTPVSAVKLKWGDYEVDEILAYECILRNNTGRTLRNISFCLNVGNVSETDFLFVLVDRKANAFRTTEISNDDIQRWSLKYDSFERAGASKLEVLSSCRLTFSLTTDADLEVIQTNAGTRKRQARIDLYYSLASVIAAAALTTFGLLSLL